MAITISDLARTLGVSHVTVSNAVHGTGRMAAATRARIVAAAEAHGCLPQAAARAMRVGRTGAVTLLHGQGFDRRGLSSELIEGLLAGLGDSGVRLQIASLPGDAPGDETGETSLPRRLSDWSSDGLLVNFAERIPAALDEQIARYALPTVWLNARRPLAAVIPDDAGIGQLAAEQLLSRGHRALAFLDFSYTEAEMHRAHSSAVERPLAAVAAARAVGGNCLVLRRPADGSDRVQAAATLIQAHPQISGWIVAADTTAMPWLIAAAQCGLVVPRDRSVVAIGSQQAQHVGCVLTTVQVPFIGIGRTAAEMVLHAIGTGARQPSQTVRGVLLPGDSVQSGPG